MADINGIAHIQLSVSNMERSLKFYSPLLSVMGMIPVFEGDTFYYGVGGRTAIAITPIANEFVGDVFNQQRIGLHHICFRTKSITDVDELYQKALELGANIIRKPEKGDYAPGYYSTLFEDPDGIRIEINFVPGKGLLDEAKN